MNIADQIPYGKRTEKDFRVVDAANRAVSTLFGCATITGSKYFLQNPANNERMITLASRADKSIVALVIPCIPEQVAYSC